MDGVDGQELLCWWAGLWGGLVSAEGGVLVECRVSSRVCVCLYLRDLKKYGLQRTRSCRASVSSDNFCVWCGRFLLGVR